MVVNHLSTLAKRVSAVKICFYSISTHLGGAERSLLEILNHLKQKKQDYDILVLVPREGGPLLKELDRLSIRYESILMPKNTLRISRRTPFLSFLLGMRSIGSLYRYYNEVKHSLATFQPDVIYTTGIKCHFLGALLGRHLGIPVVWHLRDIFKAGITKLLLTITYFFTRPRVLANSIATAKSFLGSTQKIEVIYNGIDTGRLSPNPNDFFRTKYNLAAETIIIGCMGALSRWKGQIEFLEMAHQLKAELPDRSFAFLIIGDQIYDTATDKKYHEKLYDVTDQLHLSESVFFHPFILDNAKAINALDLLVHTSIEPEPFGRIVIEALACGVPVVAAKAGGIPEIFQENHAAFLYEMANVKEMTASVRNAIEHKKVLGSKLNSGIELVKKRFSRETYLQEMEAVFAKYD